MLYLEKELVFSDSLDWFDQVRGDGVGQAMSLLDFLKIKKGKQTRLTEATVFIILTNVLYRQALRVGLQNGINKYKITHTPHSISTAYNTIT